MKTPIFILCLLLTASGLAYAATPDGTIAFDCPDAPRAKFQFHFTRELIALTGTAAAFNSVSDIYFRTYLAEAGVFDRFVAHYAETLKAANWQNLQADNAIHLHILEAPNSAQRTILGIFAVVQSDSDVHLLNIVGKMPSEQIKQLLAKLDQIGIKIPALNALDLQALVAPMPLPTLFRTAGEQPDFFRVAFSRKSEQSRFGLTFSRSHNVSLHGHWNYYGHPIERIDIRSDNKESITRISQAFQSGTADIEAVLESLPFTNTPKKDKRKLVVRAWERSATISVGDIPDHKNEPSMLSKQFRTKVGAPVHEIRIQGYQNTHPDDVRKVLEKAPEEIEAAIGKLTSELTDLESAQLRIAEEGERRTAIVTIVEKPLPTHFYFDGTPQVGFNRVTGWELGAGFDSGFREQKFTKATFSRGVPPEFRWDELSKLFGRVSYGFGNKQLYYRGGGTVAWGKPDSWYLGLTAQFHRQTSVIARDLFPIYDETGAIILRVLGVPDHQNYYLRKGVEVVLQWQPIWRRHSLKLILLAESDDSLRKNTDWHFFNWRSTSKVRENPWITPGHMRSAMFRYDFNTRNSDFGWHNTFFIEHSNPTFGSDFGWTRLQTHLRYAFPVGKHQIRLRSVVASATAPLPIQRQFVMGGIGTLNGYPLYAFAGDAGSLFNMEFLYNLYNFGQQNLSVSLILDGGRVWDVSESEPSFDPKGSIGIGLQLANDVDLFRINVAKAFDPEQDIRFNFMFFYSF